MTASSGFPADFGLRVAKHGPDARVVTVVGQVDGPTGLELAHSLIAQLGVARVVIVDLDGVQLLGSVGLSALFEANELAIRQGRVLRLVCHSRIAMRALEAAGLRECFAFADSMPEALKHSDTSLSSADDKTFCGGPSTTMRPAFITRTRLISPQVVSRLLAAH